MLRLPPETAEQVKLTHGHAYVNDLPLDQPFVVTGFGDDQRITVQRRDVTEILQARAEELFGMIMQEVKRSGYDGLLPAGLVLTGGASQLPGIREVAREVTGLPVRLAQPRRLQGLVDALHSPAYSTAIGLLQWGVQDVVARPNRRRRPALNWNFRGWLRNLLPN
jgi:cell division protein FtsA